MMYQLVLDSSFTLSPEITVVAVPSSCAQGRGKNGVTVSFFDGTIAHSNDVVELDGGGLDLLFVAILAGARTQAKLGQLEEGESESVLTIVPNVTFDNHRQRTFISHIISPRCTCVNVNGSKLHETSQLFSFSLPIRNTNVLNVDNSRRRWLPVDNFVLGAPVFNMEGEWVGFPHKRATSSLDMKLGIRGEVFQHNLNRWLAGRQWEVIIQPYVDEFDDVFPWYSSVRS